MVFTADGDYEAASDPGFRVQTLAFPEEHLRRLAAELQLDRDGLFARRTDQVFRLGRSFMDTLRVRVSRVSQLTSSAITPDSQAMIREELEFGIPAKILGALAGSGRNSRPRTDDLRTSSARVARDHLERHAREDIRIRELCQELGVSWRTLDYGFRQNYGVGPKQYLQSVRLDGVRRELRTAAPGTLIRDVALRWGFWHSSQFAKDYRRQFGQLPSETLRR
jgi:AraC family ethanolamine operon transcriptional activator